MYQQRKGVKQTPPLYPWACFFPQLANNLDPDGWTKCGEISEGNAVKDKGSLPVCLLGLPLVPSKGKAFLMKAWAALAMGPEDSLVAEEHGQI